MNEIHSTEPISNELSDQPGFAVPAGLESEIDELISHYPRKRSASPLTLMSGSLRAAPITRSRASGSVRRPNM